jgi:hypothetical protein
LSTNPHKTLGPLHTSAVGASSPPFEDSFLSNDEAEAVEDDFEEMKSAMVSPSWGIILLLLFRLLDEVELHRIAYIKA